MTHDADRILAALEPEIDRKCAELRAARRERRRFAGFLLLCAAALLLPTLFVLAGFSLLILLIPALFAAVGLLLLSPVLISQQGGRPFEQI